MTPGVTRRVRITSIALAAFVVMGCQRDRGPEPPRPTEVLVPTSIGLLDGYEGPPYQLADGSVFPSSASTDARRVYNWPETAEAPRLKPWYGALLFTGVDAAGRTWYYITSPPDEFDGCRYVTGGVFDDGDAIIFSSGLRVPKAAGFSVRGVDTTKDPGFPGHQEDQTCLDETGAALWFEVPTLPG